MEGEAGGGWGWWMVGLVEGGTGEGGTSCNMNF